jgi:hypothetical protein
LCAKDSDQDGYTNGQELGDPDCKVSFSGFLFMSRHTFVHMYSLSVSCTERKLWLLQKVAGTAEVPHSYIAVEPVAVKPIVGRNSP